MRTTRRVLFMGNDLVSRSGCSSCFFCWRYEASGYLALEVGVCGLLLPVFVDELLGRCEVFHFLLLLLNPLLDELRTLLAGLLVSLAFLHNVREHVLASNHSQFSYSA